jgi:hypothetical protein
LVQSGQERRDPENEWKIQIAGVHQATEVFVLSILGGAIACSSMRFDGGVGVDVGGGVTLPAIA